MAYALKELHEAIINSGRTVAGYTVSDEYEHGSGTIYFTKDATTESPISQIYATPGYDELDDDTIFKLNTPRTILLPIEAHFESDAICFCGQMTLSGRLEHDLELYFSILKVEIEKAHLQYYAKLGLGMRS